MKTTLYLTSLALAAALLAPASSAQSTLQRVPARPAQPLAPRFDAQDFTRRLALGDLDQREQAYEQLLDLARRDEGARQWVEQRAADASAGELGWTCRLLQRELQRARGAGAPFGMPGGMPGDDLLMGDPFGDLQDLQRRMQDMFSDLEQRWRAPQAAPWSAPAPNAPNTQNAPQSRGGGQSSARSVQIQSDEKGAVVTITEDVDGEQKTREFRADSLEQLLQEHPELRAEIGLGSGSAGQGLQWHFFNPQRGFAAPAHPFAAVPWGFDAQRGASPSSGLRTDILGVRITSVDDARRRELELDAGVGLQVQGTEPGTIASVLGIGAGDVLVEINGRPIHSREDISAQLQQRAPGSELSVSWIDSSGARRTRTWRDGDGKPPAVQKLEVPRQDA